MSEPEFEYVVARHEVRRGMVEVERTAPASRAAPERVHQEIFWHAFINSATGEVLAQARDSVPKTDVDPTNLCDPANYAVAEARLFQDLGYRGWRFVQRWADTYYFERRSGS